MAFDDMKKIQTWGVALAVSVALHMVVLGALICMKGCDSSEKPAVPPSPPVTTDGRATDLPATRAQTGGNADETPASAEKSGASAQPLDASAKTTTRKPDSRKAASAKAEQPKKVPAKTPAVKDAKSAKDAKPVAADGKDGWKPYKVKPGDSLTKIAKQCGCTVQELAKANGLGATANLQLGQTIKIKSATPDEE